MSATLDQRTDLLKALYRNPEDETLWMAFADFLDAQDSPRVKCPACRGEDWSMLDVDHKCRDCGGTGTVLDASDADLAEWVRVNAELADPNLASHIVWSHACENPRCGACSPLRRSRELLALRGTRWRKATCPGCRGTGDETSDGQGTCGWCRGTGDLFHQPDPYVPNAEKPLRTVADPWTPRMSVSCTLAEIGREERCEGCYGVERHGPTGHANYPTSLCPECGGKGCRFVPSAWARAVVETTVVTRFVVTDRSPHPTAGEYGWGWEWSEIDPQPWLLPWLLPKWLFDEIKPGSGRENATTALAGAACRVVRKVVYGG